VNFDLNKEGVIGVTNSMYDDSSISLSINPSLWKTSSDSKKLYVLFHELGHDILNFRHGEGGKMMFTISESDYSFKDFYNDKDYMFKSFFKSFFN
jgi:Zn-dependent peptidase ImmA (M78 family)